MRNRNQTAKINIKALIVVVLVTVALGTSLFTAREVRRTVRSKTALEEGTTAFEGQDWLAAYKSYALYLGRNPDDIEILQKYAKAGRSIRPINTGAIKGAMSAYRRVIQLSPSDKEAYDTLAMLYAQIGNYEELAYIARLRLDVDPNGLEAPLWLSDALISLNKYEEARARLLAFTERLEALPEKHVEYVRACLGMSQIEMSDASLGAETRALAWLDKAVGYSSQFAEAPLNRARFYRVTSNLPKITEEDRLALARRDLETAGNVPNEDPRVPLMLGAEWMAHNELARVAAELQVAKQFSEEAVAKQFFDLDNWKVAIFVLESELTLRQRAVAQGVALADDVLAALTEKRHRVRVLPSAVSLYLAANMVPEAKKCLKEYLEFQSDQQGAGGVGVRTAYLQALLAMAEDRLYVAINILKPLVINEASNSELLRMLAEAYSRTDQTRQAIMTLTRYIRIRPKDSEMIQQLAKEYLKLRDWNKAFAAAKLAEPLNPTDIVVKLLRIEASINLEAEQENKVNMAGLDLLSSELDQLRRDHPDRVDIRILQAIIAMYREQPDQAERDLKLAIEECQEPLRAEMQLVRHYYSIKRVADAVAVNRSACERHGDVAEPWLSLSGLYVAENDYDSARDCLRQGLVTAQGKWEKRSLTIRLALLELVQGDREIGIGLLDDLVAGDEQEIYARTLLLGIREVQKKPARAEELVEALKKAEGESGLQWRLHQASLWLASDTWRSKQQAITDLLQYCMDSDPEWSSPMLLSVDMYEKLGDTKRIEDLCRQALLRNPSDTDVADRLVSLFEKQGRYSDAEQVLQQIQLDPRMTSAWHIRIALRAGDFTRAINELRLRVSNDDRDANSRILLARLIYWQTKDAKQAFVYLDEAEAITPGSLTLIAARVSILNAEGHTEEARTIIDDYVTHANTFGAYMMRAAFLASRGDLEHASQDYRKLTTFKEYSVTGYELFSNFYVSHENFSEAVNVLEEGLVEFPADSRLNRRLLKTLLLQGQAAGQDRALEILASLKTEFPNDPELLKLEALQMLRIGTPEAIKSAREILENVIKLEPTAVDAHQALIDMSMRNREYESARDYAIQALGANPSNLTLILARGRAELALQNTQMAVELARMTLEKDPNSLGSLSLLASAAIQSNDHNLLKEASELARVTLGKDPNNIDTLSLLASVAIQSTDRNLLKEVSTLIESLLGDHLADEQLLVSRAQIQAAMNTPQVAIPELQAYCQNPDGSRSTTALVTLADLYRLNGDMDPSGQVIDQVEQLDPNSMAVIHCRFLWLVAQRRFEELNGVSSAYLSAKQSDTTILKAAAATLVASGLLPLKQEGLKLYEYLVTLLPRSLEVRQALASSLYQTGQVERAKTVYEALLNESPNDIRVLNDLAWILQEQDHQYDTALELVNKGLSLSPENLNLLDTRGAILLNMPNRLVDAKRDFQRLVELSEADSPRQAAAFLQLGRACIGLKDLAQARQYTSKAMDIDQKIRVFTPEERAEIEKINASGVL